MSLPILSGRAWHLTPGHPPSCRHRFDSAPGGSASARAAEVLARLLPPTAAQSKLHSPPRATRFRPTECIRNLPAECLCGKRSERGRLRIHSFMLGRSATHPLVFTFAVATTSRLIAPVGPLEGSLRTQHSIGLPGGPRERMPYPQLAVIEVQGEDVYLFRYTADREFGGDTWHESIAAAKEQAKHEYEAALGEWHEVPEPVDDPVEYALTIGLISPRTS